MSEHENRQLVEQAYATFKAGDIPTLLQSLSEDVTWQLPEIENVPFAGKRQGRGAVGEFFSTLASLQDARSFEEREFIAQGDKVVVLGHYVWQVKANERTIEGDFAHVLHRPRRSDRPSTSTWTQPRSPKRTVRFFLSTK
jgi:ketosteroid isomerase-like protein